MDGAARWADGALVHFFTRVGEFDGVARSLEQEHADRALLADLLLISGERQLRRALAGYAGRGGGAEDAGHQGACAGVAAGRGWLSVR
jgi:hypothetical protein